MPCVFGLACGAAVCVARVVSPSSKGTFELVFGGFHLVDVTDFFFFFLVLVFVYCRQVRDIYWRMYNNLYVYGSDQLIPAYPTLPDDGGNSGVRPSYQRSHLDLFL